MLPRLLPLSLLLIGLVAVVQSQSRIPPRFGSEEIKPALVFSDPVDVHPASLLPASGKSESDTKPHRYLEPDINAGTPSPLKDPLPLEDTRNTPSKETPSPLTGTHDYVEGLTQSATNNREVGSFRSATSFSTSEKVRDSDRYGVTTSSKSDDSSRDSAGRWSSFRHPTQSSSNSYNDPLLSSSNSRPSEDKDVELIENIAEELRYLNSKLVALKERRERNLRNQLNSQDEGYRGGLSAERDLYRGPSSLDRDPYR
ncbi:unnamed protein product [Notodromas monacha]|uniref:Uncharacterized protein n=1 Tax=Notodromas monacha TaxID=399045 RepID=A0A7R9C1Q8_9CRUS|nr:unnamed protein product [Notodromas monacha]CAG0924212.1 unnamed protein product [Notodromas monacha]